MVILPRIRVVFLATAIVVPSFVTIVLADPSIAPKASSFQFDKMSVREARLKMEDNSFRAALVIRAKSRLDLLYGPLFERLQLAPAELDQLKELLVEKQQERSDAANAARSQGVQRNQSAPTFFAAIAINQKETDHRIENTLGANGYAAYLDYERTFHARATANRLRGRLAATREPLGPDQFERLIQAIARTAVPRLKTDAGVTSQVGAGLFPIPLSGISDGAIEESRAFLLPGQTAELVGLRDLMRSTRAARAER